MKATIPTASAPELPRCRFDDCELREASVGLQRRVDEWLCAATPSWHETTVNAARIVSAYSTLLVRGLPPGRLDALLSLSMRLGGAASEGNGWPNRLVADVVPMPDGRLHSNSRLPFPLHTDSTGREQPHAFVLLAVVELDPPRSGTLVAATHIVQNLLSSNPRLKKQLGRSAYRFGQLSGVPILSRNGSIRFRGDVAQGLDPDASDAVRAFTAALRDLEPKCRLDLRPGDVLVIDNRRALHGRLPIPGEQSRRLVRLKVPDHGQFLL